MAMPASTIRKSTYRVLLSGFLLGQQTEVPTPVVPGIAAPAPVPAAVTSPAPSSAGPHITPLPDSIMPLSSATLSVSQSLHILVGQSIFITTLSRLKRVYVSDPEVVDSFTSSPRQIVVTGRRQG
jgi:pilus assembly protein CpaC